MAARHRQAVAGDDAPVVTIEYGRGAGRQCGIDREHAHGDQSYAIALAERSRMDGLGMALTAAGQGRYTGRTSVTSGTKCRSKFWMPCCSVAVDDGQPEHAPFMFR